MVGSQIVVCFSIFLIFFSSWGVVQLGPKTSPLWLNTLAFFSETHPKQSQHDVSLREWWPVGMLGFVEILVVSNVG